MDELKKLFIKIGYSEEEYNEIVNAYGVVDLKTKTLIKKVKENYETLKSLGYTQKEIIKMTKILPSIYSYSIENIKQKIEFYNSINLHSLVLIDSKLLMQSTKLSYARYQFLKEKGIDINEANYKKLFVAQKQFEKQYGITNQEILEKYPYNNSEEIKSTQDLGRESVKEQVDVESIDNMSKKLTDRIKEKQMEKENK